MDSGTGAAEGTVVAMSKAIALPLHRQGIEGEQRISEQIAHASQIFYALSGLHCAQHTCY